MEIGGGDTFLRNIPEGFNGDNERRTDRRGQTMRVWRRYISDVTTPEQTHAYIFRGSMQKQAWACVHLSDSSLIPLSDSRGGASPFRVKRHTHYMPFEAADTCIACSGRVSARDMNQSECVRGKSNGGRDRTVHQAAMEETTSQSTKLLPSGKRRAGKALLTARQATCQPLSWSMGRGRGAVQRRGVYPLRKSIEK